jgi:hypothetical protein
MGYSFKVRIPSEKSLKDVTVKNIRLLHNLVAKILKKGPPHFDVSLLCISLCPSTDTAALLEGMGGMYIPMNLSTSLFLRMRNSLNLLLILNSP